MSSLKLSDQLGAMAIIDELYQQQIALGEHLDLPGLRQKIARRIDDYYRAQGRPVDQKLIDEGVRLWFADRLRFQVPKSAKHQRLLAFIYLRRRWIGWSLLVGLTLCTLVTVLDTQFERVQNKRSEQKISQQLGKINSGLDQIAALRRKAESLKYSPLSYATEAIPPLELRFNQNLLGFEQLQQQAKILAAAPRDSLKINELIQINKDIADKQLALTASLAHWQKLTALDKELTLLASVKDFKTDLKNEPYLQQSFDNAVFALRTGRASVEQDVRNAGEAYQWLASVKVYRQQLSKWESGFKAMKMPAADTKAMMEMIRLARKALVEADNADFNYYWNQLEYMDKLANTRLQIKVVDRMTQRSSVQRTDPQSGAAVWYLIVEAVTPNGQIFPIQFQDSVSGKMVTAKTFGIRVSEKEYRRVKKELASMGRISDRLIGEKPIGRIQFTYSRPVMSGMIAEW